MLENSRLKVFRAVAQHLSFRKAAETLYLTQPAVTLQVKALEEELGLKLFERSSTGVALTEAGRLLLEDAEQLHQISVRAENRLAALQGKVTGELVLGASTTIAQYYCRPCWPNSRDDTPAFCYKFFGENTEYVGLV